MKLMLPRGTVGAWQVRSEQPGSLLPSREALCIIKLQWMWLEAGSRNGHQDGRHLVLLLILCQL